MTTTKSNGEIVKGNAPEKSDCFALLKRSEAAIKQALPTHVNRERFGRIAFTALRGNRDLQACDPLSFMACLLQSAQLGLEPNTPLQHAFLIPRGGQCTLQIGYQGMLDLARRSGMVRSITAHVVYAADHFVYTLGDDEKIEHVPAMSADPGEVRYAYAIATLDDGSKIRRVVTRREIDAARKMGAGKGPWSSHFDEMARKTAIRRLYKLLPKSAEMAAASQIEDADERGIATTRAITSDVREILEGSAGLSLPAPTYDVETGEVVEAPETTPA
jgi:recombination protein RecT